MKSLLTLTLALPSVLGSPALFPQADSAAPRPADHRIPTSYESAVMGRRILALSKLADFSTTFPTSSSSSPSPEDEVAALGRPEGLAGLPINMMDYIAECEDSGNPTVLAINIATTFRNAAAGSNVSVSLRWTPPYPPAHRIPLSLWGRLSEVIFGPGEESSAPPDTAPYSAANLPRLSLLGYFEPIEPAAVPAVELAACFVAKHPDAKYWLPGNAIHKSSWARLVVTQVYWVGGFGDRAYIGWIPIEEWQSVTKEEWSSITLPGEKKGWREWGAVEGSMEPDL